MKTRARLEPLLRMICGLEIALDKWDAVEPVLYAAEKYDMPGPASIVRALLRTPAFADGALRLYAAACHFGRAEDARSAFTHSLTVNLYDLKKSPALPRLHTADLLASFELHHEWRKQFHQRIAESPFLTDAQLGDAARCSRCHDSISYVEWRDSARAVECDVCQARDLSCWGHRVGWPGGVACGVDMLVGKVKKGDLSESGI